MYNIKLGDKEEGDNEVGDQARRYRQPRQQNWYNSYRGNRRGPPQNRGEGDYNVRIIFFEIMIYNNFLDIQSCCTFKKFSDL